MESQKYKTKIFVVLLHWPMKDRQGKIVSTAVTNMDIHDISRSCRTFEVSKYFIVNPDPRQEEIVQRILGHWSTEQSQEFHPARVNALSLAAYRRTFEEALAEATEICGGRPPLVAMPDAQPLPEAWSYDQMRSHIEAGTYPGVMIVFGTGWGIAPEFFSKVDRFLAPLRGPGPYFHLSVRSAVAIILDRILGMK